MIRATMSTSPVSSPIVRNILPGGCVIPPPPKTPSSETKAKGKDKDTVSFNESINGKTVKVKAGADFVLRLASNPTTGYSWKVVSTDRSFGYPKQTFEGRGGGRVGSGGTAVFTWDTKDPFDQGKHRVTLAYVRGNGKPLKTVSFTVDVR